MRAALLAAIGAAVSAVTALPTISAKGSKFFTSDGKQFFVKGIAYQLTPADPLAQPSQCALDAALMKTIGTNSIRVYHVDPAADHTSCMKTFSDAGIYLWLDLDTFSTQIEPNSPAWNQTQYDAFAKVMDAFHQFDNLAGFFVGNEVLTKPTDSAAAPFVKAAARDMKAYRDSKGYRNIPIGYSAADIATLRPNLQNYLACGTNTSESIDFFALNAYEWCGSDVNYQTSGYEILQGMTKGYNIPIFFSETGCVSPRTRTFADMSAIFGSQMVDTWSGAIVYEWIQETNDYGLISYGPSAAATATGANIEDGYTRVGTPTPIQPDFSNLSNQWKTLSPTGVAASAYTPSLTPVACPSFTSGTWEVNGLVALPTLGQSLDQNLKSSYATASGTPAATGSSSGAVTNVGGARATSSSSSSSSSSGIGARHHELNGVSAWIAGMLMAAVAWL